MVKVDKQAAGFDEGRPTVADLHGDNPFAQAAKRHWLKEKPSKFKPDVLKTDFYDLLEKEEFRFKSLLILENLQFLEKFAVQSWSWCGNLAVDVFSRTGSCGPISLRTRRIFISS